MNDTAAPAWLGAWRQWFQPREFRIDAPSLPPDAWGALERALAEAAVSPAPGADVASPAAPEAAAEARRRQRFLADVATGLWRLRKRMLEPGTDRPKEAFRREVRHLEAVWDLLADAGVKVVDHTGQPFDPGQRLEVAGQVETPGLVRPRVQETVKPTIYVDDEHVQWGVVLVENPAPA